MKLSATTTRSATQAMRARVVILKLNAIGSKDCATAKKELLALVPQVTKLLAADIRGALAPDDPTHAVGMRFLEVKRKTLKRCAALNGLGAVTGRDVALYVFLGGAVYLGMYWWLASDGGRSYGR